MLFLSCYIAQQSFPNFESLASSLLSVFLSSRYFAPCLPDELPSWLSFPFEKGSGGLLVVRKAIEARTNDLPYPQSPISTDLPFISSWWFQLDALPCSLLQQLHSPPVFPIQKTTMFRGLGVVIALLASNAVMGHPLLRSLADINSAPEVASCNKADKTGIYKLGSDKIPVQCETLLGGGGWTRVARINAPWQGFCQAEVGKEFTLRENPEAQAGKLTDADVNK